MFEISSSPASSNSISTLTACDGVISGHSAVSFVGLTCASVTDLGLVLVPTRLLLPTVSTVSIAGLFMKVGAVIPSETATLLRQFFDLDGDAGGRRPCT